MKDDAEYVRLEPMQVRIIDNGRTSGPEPGRNPSWDDETLVRWVWGCMVSRTGVELRVTAIRRPGRRPRFMVGCGSVGFSDCGAEAAYRLIDDLSIGWQAGYEAAGRQPASWAAR